MRLLECVVDISQDEERLDSYLALRFDYLSRNRWQKLITDEKLTLNGKIVRRPATRIKKGDTIVFEGNIRQEPDVDSNIDIVYQDDQLLVVNKSGDLPVHPAGRYFNNTALRIMESRLNRKLYPVNRIDRETSGILIFALNSSVACLLAEEWNNCHKSYIALVRGEFIEDRSCNMPLGLANPSCCTDVDKVLKKRAAYEGAPEKAFTSFSRITGTKDFSLVRAVLGTGRQHQIRAHLEYMGYPLVGDKIYGGDERIYLDFIKNGITNQTIEKVGHRRCMLHAYKAEIVTKKGKTAFIVEPPDDFILCAKNLAGIDCMVDIKKILNS
ncbi:MAG TPA: pseudouridine synthase [Spirochaetota bacterium]|nr:pseudouridine synthase [Spirochaetota bacterium]